MKRQRKRRTKAPMTKRYGFLENPFVYAVHYNARNVMIYNTGFIGIVQLYILKD